VSAPPAAAVAVDVACCTVRDGALHVLLANGSGRSLPWQYLRLAVGSDHRIVLPASALAGGLLLMTADLAARVAIAPRQLPVGALTALVGVPVFLLLVRRQRS